ncbi:MAG: hypothetical protein AAGA37_19795 [Actinomycetota bacterium]
MSNPIDAAAQLLADTLVAGCDFAGGVFPTYNPSATAGSAVIVPGDPWGDTSDGNAFCEFDVSFDIVMLQPAHNNPAPVAAWFAARVVETIRALHDADEVDAVVESWTPPQAAPGPNGDLIQVVVTLTPMTINIA